MLAMSNLEARAGVGGRAGARVTTSTVPYRRQRRRGGGGVGVRSAAPKCASRGGGRGTHCSSQVRKSGLFLILFLGRPPTVQHLGRERTLGVTVDGLALLLRVVLPWVGLNMYAYIHMHIQHG